MGALVLAGLVFISGCYHPSAANNKLRNENEDLRDKIKELDRRHAADEATIKALEQKEGTPPEISSAKVGQLFTVHGIRLGRLTGGDDWDSSKPGQDGIKVAVEPFDEQGEKLKAAGTVVVDAFDLAAAKDHQIGHWTFDATQTRDGWLGSFLYCYVLKCPWQKVPTHGEITVRVAFTDLLTGRQFTAQKAVKVEPPPAASQPSTNPASTQTHPAP
jgi:hypothetical protein